MAENRDSFVHLHVHSEYSMLDGAARVEPLIEEAVSQGMPAIALTDHGNMFGAYDFWSTATKHGIKPIIGTEAYLTPGTSRFEKTRVKWADGGEDDVSGSGAYTHMTLLAENNEGLHNLFRMSSLASIEGFYYKPRHDIDLLQKFSKGVIATTGCAGGEIQTRLRLGQIEEAKRAAAQMQDIFGKENYYCEIMDHGIEIERRTISQLIELAKDLSIPLVATNDLHYTFKEDASSHAVLLCIQSGSTLDDEKRFKFDGSEYYLKSAAEMSALFKDHPEAIRNTLLIAERSNVGFEKRDLMPKFPVPEGETEATWFESEVKRGLSERFPNGVPPAHKERAEYEVGVIKSMGFPGYFLVVADFIAWARKQGIRVGPGRGSAAGSVVAWALKITGLDPIEHGLIFERFLNPDRISMPDIDIDFDDRRRGEVIRYVTEKYGDDRVAQIVTYGTIKAKQALKDSARVLGMPYAVGERLTKAVPPPVMGKDLPLNDLIDSSSARYKEAADFRSLIELDSDAAKVFETALGIENLRRQWGVHAAGVIMSAEPLLDVLPIMKREDDGAIITQFDQPPCEKLGLLKMDFLGLRNLTVLQDAISGIKANRGIDLVLEDLDLNGDPNTYDLLARGETLGVFQLDSAPLRTLLRQLKPDSFSDITAVIALYRPGPLGMNSHIKYAQRKNGLEEIEAIHEELAEPLAEILAETYGLVIYQEQVMAAAQKVAGFTLSQADTLRKAMGKKDKEILDREFENFSAGMKEKGFSIAAAKALWGIMEPFADYGFNKSHGAAYAVLSYWTAYLKANYPAEFMAALLTSVGDSKDKLGLYLAECRRMKIRVLPPDVNESSVDFAAIGSDIRFGLGAVRNVGASVVEQIKLARETAGRFEDFYDFLNKVPAQVANKRTVESLIKAGAFDSLGSTRRALIEIYEDAIDSVTSQKRMEATGQVGFDFDDLWDASVPSVKVPDRPEWAKRDKLKFEREMLGMYISDHPLAGLERQLARISTVQIADIQDDENLSDGTIVTIAGLVNSVADRTAKNSGNPYTTLLLEDFSGEIQVSFNGKYYQEFRPMLENDAILAIKGRLDRRDDGMSLRALSVIRPELGENLSDAPIVISVSDSHATTEVVTALNDVLIRHAGTNDVRLKLISDESERMFEIPFKVTASADLYGELKALLGPSCVN